MMIEYAILGLLSWKPLSGYDIKKIITASDVFYWSGNNNQIYNTLVQLRREDKVTQETHPQENLPAKKIYAITKTGRADLRRWVQSEAELPEFRSTFLIQLAWADQLADDALDQMLERYEAEIALQVRMQQEKAARGQEAPNRTPRETYLWNQIEARIRGAMQQELEWVRGVRQGLKA